jgi:hypothetical protein
LVPVELADVEQEGPGGVRVIRRVRASPGQPGNEIGVDGAESETAGLGIRSKSGDIVEEPGHLGTGEVGIDHQAGALGYAPFPALFLELLAQGSGPAILPHDRGVDRS